MVTPHLRERRIGRSPRTGIVILILILILILVLILILILILIPIPILILILTPILVGCHIHNDYWDYRR